MVRDTTLLSGLHTSLQRASRQQHSEQTEYETCTDCAGDRADKHVVLGVVAHLVTHDRKDLIVRKLHQRCVVEHNARGRPGAGHVGVHMRSTPARILDEYAAIVNSRLRAKRKEIVAERTRTEWSVPIVKWSDRHRIDECYEEAHWRHHGPEDEPPPLRPAGVDPVPDPEDGNHDPTDTETYEVVF